MTELYVTYVLYKDKNGFYNETKICREVDLEDIIEKNGLIESFYGENVYVESFNGLNKDNQIIFIKNNSLFYVPISDVVKEITEKLHRVNERSYKCKLYGL